MFTRLIKTEDLAIDNRTYNVRYFETKTLRGSRRFSSEIVVGPGPADRIILDDDSLSSLQSKVQRLAPATIYSRQLASRLSAAA